MERRGGGRNSKLPRRIIVVAVVAVSILAFVAVRSAVVRPEPVTIAVIVPLSGANAYMSEVRDAMMIAADEVNRWGGVNGRELQLVFADSESDPNVAEQEFDRIEEEHRPVMYVSALSSVSLRLAERAEEAEVPLMGLLTSVLNFTYEKEWVFRYYFQTMSEAGPICDALEWLNIDSLGIIRSDEVYGREVADMVKGLFEAQGGTVELVSLDPVDTDYTQEIAEASSNDAIYVATLRSQLVPILTEINQTGYQGEVMAVSGASAPTVRSIPDIEGVYTAAPLLYNDGYYLGTALVEKYLERYGVQLSHQGATGYDTIRLVTGLLEGHEASRENLRELLSSGYIHTGVLGVLDLESGEHEINFELFSARIVGGEVEYI
jgi:branched-chain amino acid transport system substrate-binding protein